MIYELINPSDPYTMVYDDDEIARTACILLGESAYALKNENGGEVCPLLLLGATAFINKEYGSSAKFFEYVTENMLRIGDCLDSVMSFGPSERFAYEEAVKVMTDKQRKEYRDKVHDRNMSSMNNIGARAWTLAETFRQRVEDKQNKRMDNDGDDSRDRIRSEQ